jgi:hypothetical protein
MEPAAFGKPTQPLQEKPQGVLATRKSYFLFPPLQAEQELLPIDFLNNLVTSGSTIIRDIAIFQDL